MFKAAPDFPVIGILWIDPVVASSVKLSGGLAVPVGTYVRPKIMNHICPVRDGSLEHILLCFWCRQIVGLLHKSRHSHTPWDRW